MSDADATSATTGSPAALEALAAHVTTTTPASPARAIWLLARLRLTRLRNLLTSARFGRKKNQASRAATPARRRLGLVLPTVVLLLMLFPIVHSTSATILNLHCHLARSTACLTAHPDQPDLDLAAREIQSAPFDQQVAAALALQLSLLLTVSVLLPLGTRELSQPDWDLEWLVTLPVRRSTLLWGRLFERTIANPIGLIALVPICSILAWYSGFRWSALPIGLAGALTLLPLSALVRTLVDTGLRMALPPSQLRNLQAFAGIAGLPFLYMSMGFATPSALEYLVPVARAVPASILWTPQGLLLQTINAPTLPAAAMALALLLGQVALALGLGMLVLRRQLRYGVVATGSRETGRKPRAAAQAAESSSRFVRWLPSSAIQRRELRLLSRDRNFLVQSMVTPVLIIGSQFVVNYRHGAVDSLLASPTALAATAFGLAAYMLMMSALQTINNEGQSLWLLFTFPRSLDSVLREKAQLWAVLALVYPLLIFGAGVLNATTLNWRWFVPFVIVLVGVPVYSTIAVALGVFACDPLSQDVRTRLRPSYTYLYASLAGMYTYAIMAGAWWQKLALMLLSVCLAQALWQKARDELPYLLDNAAAPPARVSTSDGMIAAMLFFILQALGTLLLSQWFAPGQALVLAFAAAGLLAYGLTRYVYWRAKTTGVPTIFGPGVGVASIGWGAVLGVAAAGIAIGYLSLLNRYGLMPAAEEARRALPPLSALWMIALAVIAAPVCEEFIFRGLVFGGMRRSLPLPLAMCLSAGLFAIVHPPLAMAPVFVLGLCTAFAYQRTRSLLAPMLVHAVYNAAVLTPQLLGT
jgi:ABC-2 type transport system permease protein